MAATTAKTLIKDAADNVGAIAVSQDLTPEEYQKGFRALNAMLASWSAENLMIPATTEEDLSLVSGTNSYTIGPSGDFNTARPIRVDGALIRSGNDDYPVEIITENEYRRIQEKSSGGRPYRLYYKPTFTTGTVYLYPSPSDAYTLRLYSYKYITAFATLTTSFTFEDAYLEAIEYNLSIRLGPKLMGKPAPLDVRDLAKTAKDAILALNLSRHIDPVTVDFADKVSNGSIYSDSQEF